MIIAVDAMGGDNAPKAIVEGSIIAAEKMPRIDIFLVGNEKQVRSHISRQPNNLTIIDAKLVLDGDNKIGKVRSETEASIVKAAFITREGLGFKSMIEGDAISMATPKADAMVAFGHTGIAVTATTLHIERLEGINRAGIAVRLPNNTILIDGGAVSDCSIDNMEQFAALGIAYAKSILRIKKPQLTLLSIGEESSKGDELTKYAYASISQLFPDNFIGNIEGRDLLLGEADVVVTNGFTGNVALKSLEAVYAYIEHAIRQNPLLWLPFFFALPLLAIFKKKLNCKEYGGAPLLGLKEIVIIGHGNSDARAVYNGIKAAVQMVKSDLRDTIQEELSALSINLDSEE